MLLPSSFSGKSKWHKQVVQRLQIIEKKFYCTNHSLHLKWYFLLWRTFKASKYSYSHHCLPLFYAQLKRCWDGQIPQECCLQIFEPVFLLVVQYLWLPCVQKKWCMVLINCFTGFILGITYLLYGQFQSNNYSFLSMVILDVNYLLCK